MVIFDRQLAVTWSKNGKLLEKDEHKEEFQVRNFDKQLSIFQNCFGNRSNLLRRGTPLKLTLTRPIGLPPHAPVAQKIADQR